MTFMTQPAPKRSIREALEQIAKEQEQAGINVSDEEAEQLASEALAEVRREMAQERADREANEK